MTDYTAALTGLLETMDRSRFTQIEVVSGPTRIVARKPARAVAPGPQAVTVTVPAPAAGQPAAAAVYDRTLVLESPRVGRFVERQDPKGQPLLKAGDRLARGDVYGAIESMHLQYEVRAEKDGTVERLLVSSGEPVEFGQPLVLLRA
jgi:acetyl-CoA carboxylase biotin carboxyl carrier protein